MRARAGRALTWRAEVRSRVRSLAGTDAPDHSGEVTVDLDGVRVLAHSDKQDATAIRSVPSK